MRRTTRNAHRTGAAAVEFAFVVIPFIVFVFGILEFGRLMMVKDLMTEASREAARLASLNTNVTESDQNDMAASEIETKIQGLINGQGLEDLAIDFSHLDDPTSDWKTDATLQHQIEVTISCNYKPMTPLIGIFSGNQSNSIPMSTTSVAYSEGH